MFYLIALSSIALVFRGAIIFLLPLGAYSLDLAHYLEIQNLLDRGENPYVKTAYLNYGPLWLQVLWALRNLSDLSGIPREITIKLFYALTDSISISFLYCIGTKRSTAKKAFLCCLFGFAVNPVILVLSCLHASFDSLLLCCMLGSLLLLMLFFETKEISFWYAACLTLGYGILAKTVPILLLPLFTTTRSLQKPWQFMFGGLICLTPMLIGLSTLYVLFPSEIQTKVLEYVAVPGYFGITGILRLVGFGQSFDVLYAQYFKVLLLIIMIAQAGFASYFSKVIQFSLISFPVFNFLFVVTLGPGFGPQYLFWVITLLIMQIMLLDDGQISKAFRYLLYVFLVVASFTVLFEYSYSSGLSGTIALNASSIEDYRGAQRLSTLVRLPLFASMLFLLVAQFYLMLKESKSCINCS